MQSKLLFALLFSVLASCSSNDDNPNKSSRTNSTSTYSDQSSEMCMKEKGFVETGDYGFINYKYAKDLMIS